MSITSVRLLPEIEDPLEHLSKKLDRSKNNLINQALKEFLQRTSNEDIRKAQTLEALESVKSGHLIDEAQVHDWLDSWGTDNELDPPV